MSKLTRSVARCVWRAGTSIGASIARTFPEHVPLYICAVVFMGATLVIVHAYHLPLPLEASAYFLGLVPVFVALGIALSALTQLVALIRAGRPRHPALAIARALGGKFLEEDRPGNAFHSLVTMTPLMICFAALKDDVPNIHPFSWDHTFMLWDRDLGFGHLPWQILQPVLGHPIVTFALNTVYDSWFLVMFGCFFWQAFSTRGGVARMQYLLAFAFSWFIAGNLLAVLFSSAGPCFYGQLHLGPDRYAQLMAYLHAVNRQWPIWSVGIQDLLWKSYLTGSGAISGISAMPSMHVTSTVVIALIVEKTNRRLGLVAAIYTGLIVIGSIQLGWHYAVDSVAGIILAFAFWALAGVIARIHARRLDMRSVCSAEPALGIAIPQPIGAHRRT